MQTAQKSGKWSAAIALIHRMAPVENPSAMTEAAASAVAPDDTLSDDPIEVLQRRHAADLIYEQEHCRHRLKTQAQFYEMKLETSRLAAQVNVEHKAVEVAAACARNYEEKLKLLAAGGSLEAQLMIRIEEMGEELGRLHTFEKEMHAARQELSDKEAEFAKHRGDTEADMAKALRDKEAEMAMALRDKEAEFDKERGALLALREDVRTCQSLMARRVMDELGIDELSSGTGTDVEALQANVKEVLAKYGAKIRQLQAEVDAALKQRDELADASKAAEASKAAALEEVAALGMELLATRAAWDAAVAREAEALAETSDARAKLADAHEQIGEISSQLSEMTAQARAAEDARDLAQAEARAILARTEALVAQAKADADAREADARAELEASRAAAAAAQDVISRLREENAALRAEAEGGAARARAYEHQVRELQVLKESLERDKDSLEKEVTQLRTSESCLRDQLSGITAAHQHAIKELEARLANATALVESAEVILARERATAAATEADLRTEIAQLRGQIESPSAEGAFTPSPLAFTATTGHQGQIEALEAEVARLRAELAQSQEEALEQRELVHKVRMGEGGDVSDAWRHLELARASLEGTHEKLNKSKAAIEAMMNKTKAERAALVDYALKSLNQLSTHLTYTLAGLRFGRDRTKEAPLLRVRSYEQLHSGFGGGSGFGDGGAPRWGQPSGPLKAKQVPPPPQPGPVGHVARTGIDTGVRMRLAARLLDDGYSDAARVRTEALDERFKNDFSDEVRWRCAVADASHSPLPKLGTLSPTLGGGGMSSAGRLARAPLAPPAEGGSFVVNEREHVVRKALKPEAATVRDFAGLLPSPTKAGAVGMHQPLEHNFRTDSSPDTSSPTARRRQLTGQVPPLPPLHEPPLPPPPPPTP